MTIAANTKAELSVLPVILAGGSGTRLWPLSRAEHPKQFLLLETAGSEGATLFQQAASRVAALSGAGSLTSTATTGSRGVATTFATLKVTSTGFATSKVTSSGYASSKVTSTAGAR